MSMNNCVRMRKLHSVPTTTGASRMHHRISAMALFLACIQGRSVQESPRKSHLNQSRNPTNEHERGRAFVVVYNITWQCTLRHSSILITLPVICRLQGNHPLREAFHRERGSNDLCNDNYSPAPLSVVITPVT